MEAISNAFLRIVDYFLGHRDIVSAESRMRARMIVFTLLFWALINALALLSAKLLRWIDIVVIATCLIVSMISAFMIRKGCRPENVTLEYTAFILYFQVVGIYFSEVPIPFIVNVFISGIYTSCLIISDLRKRIVVLCIVFTANFLAFILFLEKTGSGFLILPPNVASGMLIFQVVSIIAHFVILLMIFKIQAIAQSDLDLEIEWRERMKRLDELSSMTKTMCNLLVRPIKTLERELKELEQGSNPFVMYEMQREIDELLLISQSWGWLYRAHGSGGAYSIASDTLMKQIEILLSAKAQEEHWTFEAKHIGHPVDIYGPIPSIVLFLYTIMVHILRQTQPYEKRRLLLEFDYIGGRTTWRMHWPLSARESGSAEINGERASSVAMQDLVRDMARACAASILGFQYQGAQHLLISGSWRR